MSKFQNNIMDLLHFLANHGSNVEQSISKKKIILILCFINNDRVVLLYNNIVHNGIKI